MSNKQSVLFFKTMFCTIVLIQKLTAVIVKRAVIGSKMWVEAQHNIYVVKCFVIGQ